MTLREANLLRPRQRLRVLEGGLARHGLQDEVSSGEYLCQFESPARGRMVVVRLQTAGAYGFTLEELELETSDSSLSSGCWNR